MKIAVVGKGGSGKTTVAAALCLEFKNAGKQVIALDCDPDANLSIALGFPARQDIKPITAMKELIAERTEVESLDKPSTFFKINPKVDDIPDKFSVTHNGIKLLVMGKVSKAGSGCMCPENAFIKRLMSHLILNRNEVVIMDMVAGSEHLGRATAASVDVALIIAEPTQLGVATAGRIEGLLKDLGIKKRFFLGNKIINAEDKNFLSKNLKNIFLGFVHLSSFLTYKRGVFEFDEALKKEFDAIFNNLSKK